MKHDKSKRLFKEAQASIPGGVDSPVRAFKSVNSTPVFAKSGSGYQLRDVDGNVYDDYILSWGPLILGHAHKAAAEGVSEVLENGATFGLPTELETELAELIKEDYPSIEKIRFVNSGTEAVMSAIRLARGFTGREKIVKFSGGYHGHADSVLVDAGSGLLTESIATSNGITKGVINDTYVLDYNDSESVRELFKSEGENIAAVIVEPVAGNMGVIVPEEGFLETLREICAEYGALLIFDEVITGYRVGLGGMQEKKKISPDLTILGKIIGGGLPVGAFGGKGEIMDSLAPDGAVYQAGTLSGNPVAMKMGINQVQYLKTHPEVYLKLENLAAQLEDGLRKIIKKTGVPASVSRQNGMITLFFREKAPSNYGEVKEADTELYSKYFNGMLERGILVPPSQFEALFLSAAHDETAIKRFLESAEEVLAELSEKEI